LHKAFVIVPLVGWAGVAALVHYTPFSFPSKANEGTVVVVPSRSAEATGRAPVAQEPSRIVPPAGNRAALVRELQKELIRVGCYDGEISGAWTTPSRRAMRDFTDRVNAKLPIDEPDHILLSLVQGHRQKACGIACAAGQQEGPDGRCVPSALAARAAKQPAPRSARADAPAQASPVITGSTTTAAAVAAALPKPERSAAPPPAKQAYAQPSPAAADTANLPKSAAKSGPVPSLGVYDRQRRQARRAKSRPPAVVRSLVRSVKNALGIR
jgi:hypothetical protein